MNRPSPRPASLDPAEGRQIFVVDDDPDVCELICELARSSGLPAQGFSSAEAFAEAYRPGLAGCLVLDDGLPGISGLELLERLAGSQTDLPVIMSSASGDQHRAERALQLGAVGFVEKPAHLATLLRLIRQALASREH